MPRLESIVIFFLGMTLFYCLNIENYDDGRTCLYLDISKKTNFILQTDNYVKELFDSHMVLPRQINRFDVSNKLKSLLQKMTQLEASRRYQSLKELEIELYDILKIVKFDGLMYQNESSFPTHTWQGSKNYAKNLRLGGYDNWRLPTREEFKKISNIDRLYQDVKNLYFWTFEEKSRQIFCAWAISFEHPFEIWENKLGKNSVLCVREEFNYGFRSGVITKLLNGFGFIAHDKSGDEIFFHQNNLVEVEYSDLEVGDSLSFEFIEGRNNRPQAGNVQLEEKAVIKNLKNSG